MNINIEMRIWRPCFVFLRLTKYYSHDESRRMRQARHVASVGDRRAAYRVLVGNLRKRDHLEDLGLHGRIILKWIFKKWDAGAWTGFFFWL